MVHKSKRVLVTGGAGFIGSHIQDKLISLGYKVGVLDNLRSGKKKYINPKAKFYKVDLTNFNKTKKAIEDFRPETIFHLAAQNEVLYSMNNPYEDQNINILGMMNLCEVSRKFVKKIIYSNTAGVFYGEVEEKDLPIKEDFPVLKPASFYAVSKAAAEIYLKLYANLNNFKWVSLRYSNVYGPRQDENNESGVVAIFTAKLLKKETPIINGKGNHTRDYIYVDDVVEANIAALNCEESDYFNIATGVRISNLEVFNILKNELKIEVKPVFGPPRPGDALHIGLSISKARRKLKWKPKVNFKNGVTFTVNYYKSLDKG